METRKQHEEEDSQEVLLTWNAPARLFKRRDKEFYTNIGAIVFLLVIILIFAHEFFLIAAVLSIVFFVYVVSTVPPEEVRHRIINLGLDNAGTLYRWDDLLDFWVEEQWGQVMFIVRQKYGTRLILLVPENHKAKARELLAKHIPFLEKPDKTWVDNAAHWLSHKVPLEKSS